MQEPQILFEDTDLLIINKPTGMIVNKADTTRGEITIQDWAEKKIPITHPPETLEKLTPTGEYNPVYEFYSRGGIVHRIDKETSGILLLAKNPDSFGKLKKQFMERTIRKRYVALAHGKIVPEEGEINVPMGRLEFNRKRFGVVAGGRESVTRYQVIALYEFKNGKQKEIVSLVELEPKTGRTHQIRVHLKHINHPIVADELYAGRKTARDDRSVLPRLFLHAKGITFIHPTTEKRMDIEAPLPEDLATFLSSLDRV